MHFESLTLAQRAIELIPRPWGHWVRRLQFIPMSRRFGPAVEELTEALRRNPNFAFARVILVFRMDTPDWPRRTSLTEIAAAWSSSRDYAQAASLIEGLCQFIAGRHAEAVTCERRAVQLRPHRHRVAHAMAAGGPGLANWIYAQRAPGMQTPAAERQHRMGRAIPPDRQVRGSRQVLFSVYAGGDRPVCASRSHRDRF